MRREYSFVRPSVGDFFFTQAYNRRQLAGRQGAFISLARSYRPTRPTHGVPLCASCRDAAAGRLVV